MFWIFPKCVYIHYMTLAQTSGISSGQHRSAMDSQALLLNSGVDKILTDLAQRFSNVPTVRRALLVGPRARGEHDDRSDVNVALSMPDTSDSDWSRLLSMVQDSPTLLRINLVHMESCNLEQRLQAESEGLLFYHPWGLPWEQFRDSLDRLGTILLEDMTRPGSRDGLLYRFARTIDLFHKLLRVLLASRGFQERGLKDALTLSYQQRWITDEEQWLSLLQAKFWVERAYDETRVAPLVDKIPRHYALLRGTAGMLRDLFGLE